MQLYDVVHDVLTRRLASRVTLCDGERAAISGLRYDLKKIPVGSIVGGLGGEANRCRLIVSGFALRQHVGASGKRVTCGLLFPGEFIDQQQIFLSEAISEVRALTALRVAYFAVDDVKNLLARHSSIQQAFLMETLVQASILREVVVNLSCRDAITRVAHLLCEIEVRLAAAGLPDGYKALGITQVHLGEATGLTSVHVNRKLGELEAEGLIKRSQSGRAIHIVDWQGLQRRAEFDPSYLHISR